jgi:hypothetical protein
MVWRAGIAQSVYRLATGWTNKGSVYKSRWRKELPLLYVVQTDSGARPASYPMGSGGFFLWEKAAGE